MLPLPLNLQIKFAMTSLDLNNNNVIYFYRNEMSISGSYWVSIYIRNSKDVFIGAKYERFVTYHFQVNRSFELT